MITLKHPLFLLLAACGGFSACHVAQKQTVAPAVNDLSVKYLQENGSDSLLRSLMATKPEQFEAFLDHPETYKLQIIYTQIDRDAQQQPHFTTHTFHWNEQDYYYPASTVKFPASILALQKLNELKQKRLDKSAVMLTDSAHATQSAVLTDSTSSTGLPSIEHYIKKILLVSDNDAYNRLYEFLGHDYFNETLHKMGYTQTQIRHRLEIYLSDEDNRRTNPIRFYKNGQKVYQQPMLMGKYPLEERKDFLGNAYMRNGKLNKEPLNFSQKNRYPLYDFHRMIQAVVMPQAVPAKQRFKLTESDRKLLLQYMSQLPNESNYPHYNPTEIWPTYVKFLLYGSDTAAKGPIGPIRIFNKVGDAYGFLIDGAYVVDFEKQIEFFLSAVIYCNSDGVLNDNKYEYGSIGLPFLKNLGELIYDYETKRTRKYKPDLADYRLQYDR